MEYLLLESSRLPCGTMEITAAVEDTDFPEESLLRDWKTAIEHYFQSVVSVCLLQRISFKHHASIPSEQVKYIFF